MAKSKNRNRGNPATTTSGQPAPAPSKETEQQVRAAIEAVDLTKVPRYTYRGVKGLPNVDSLGNAVAASRKAGDTSDHKYAKIHKAAVEAGSPVKLGWRYATTIFTANKSHAAKREGTAHGIIQQLVREAGDTGISGMELVPLVRVRAKQNTRTNFGSGLIPPIGWAEGWIDSAVSSGIIRVVKGRTLELADLPEVAAAAEAAKQEGGNAAPTPQQEREAERAAA